MDKRRPRMDTVGYARRAFEKVRLNDPTGPLADDALMATANSHFTRGQYSDADYHYTLLRREYPKSIHIYNAHVFGIQAKVRAYQGPGYDGKLLREASDLADQTLRQFRNKSAAERERLEKIRRDIIVNRAARDMEMAQAS